MTNDQSIETIDASTEDEVHHRLVDEGDGRWSVYRNDDSGTTSPVISGATEELARTVYDHLTRPLEGDRVVIVPEVSVPAGYREKVAEATVQAKALLEQVEVLTETVGGGLLPLRERVWEAMDLPDGAPEHFEEVTGWYGLRDALEMIAAHIGGAVSPLEELGRPVDFAPDWWVAIEVERAERKLAKLGAEPSEGRLDVLSRLAVLGVPGAWGQYEEEREALASGVDPQGEEVPTIDPVAELVRVLGDVLDEGGDLPGVLSAALVEVARERGGSRSLTAGRPASWEGGHVEALARMADMSMG